MLTIGRVLISIIIPVYKVEKYLNKCIRSVVEQTYTNLEIILVDDGSPDYCPQICDKWAAKDSRIRVIHKENGGLSDARNAGLAIAQGEYIGFLDSDDYIKEDMYEKLYIAIVENNADIAICNLEKVTEEGDKIECVSPVKNEILTREVALHRILKENCWYYVTVWNKLYHKSVLSGIEFPKGKIHEDEFVIHEIIFQSQRIVTLEEKLYMYVQRNGSIMNRKKDVKSLDSIEAICKRVEFYKANGLKEYFPELSIRLKNLYVKCRLEIPVLQSKSNRERISQIDKMYKRSFFECAESISLKYKVLCTFPHIWSLSRKLSFNKFFARIARWVCLFLIELIIKL